MDGFVDLFKQKAKLAANAAGVVSRKAKLRADILFIERDIKTRQHTFGVQLYDYVSVWSARPEFFAANEDNILIATLRPPLISAQREIAALHLKRTSLKERINITSASRTASYNQKSEHWTETISNASRTTMIAGNEAKLKAELALIENNINTHKHAFGISIYQQFTLLEDSKNWLPTDREIRSLYDSCRKDIENFRKKILSKENEIKSFDNNSNGNKDGDNNPGVMDCSPHIPTASQQQLPPGSNNNMGSMASSSLPPSPQNNNSLFLHQNNSMSPSQQQQQQQQNHQKGNLDDDFW
jgi:hypothetical protein